MNQTIVYSLLTFDYILVTLDYILVFSGRLLPSVNTWNVNWMFPRWRIVKKNWL